LKKFHLFATVLALAYRGANGCRTGEAMARVLNEILPYSYMAAFVTGIVVLAAATFVG
jgi:hypothetical protein